MPGSTEQHPPRAAPIELPTFEAERARARAWPSKKQVFMWGATLFIAFFIGATLAPTSFAPAPLSAPRAGEQFLADARGLYRQQAFTDARDQLNVCIAQDPGLAECHKLLGSVYAKLDDAERGAQEYREYLRLAPNSPDADKVRAILSSYESAR